MDLHERADVLAALGSVEHESLVVVEVAQLRLGAELKRALGRVAVEADRIHQAVDVVLRGLHQVEPEGLTVPSELPQIVVPGLGEDLHLPEARPGAGRPPCFRLAPRPNVARAPPARRAPARSSRAGCADAPAPSRPRGALLGTGSC